MLRHAARFAALAAVLAVAAPALADPTSNAKLTIAAQEKAAWHGVEAKRITRDGDTIRIAGVDRSGAARIIETDCRALRVACPTGEAVSASAQ